MNPAAMRPVLIVSLWAGLAGAAAPPGPAPALPPLPVRLQADADDRLTVTMAGASVAVASLKPGVASQPVNGVVLTPTLNLRGVWLRDATRDLLVTADGFPGWTALVPTNQGMAFTVSTNRGLIDMDTATNNAAPVTLAFADGAKATMGAGSVARFDWFQDQSYYLSGHGKVHGVNADGWGMDLSRYWRPMTGGPLVPVVDAQGQSRLKRFSPDTFVALSGVTGAELEITAGAEKIRLPERGRYRVALTNGTVLEFAQYEKTNWLSWTVEKGLVQFWVGGINCWHAFGLTDQAADLSWNGATLSVDVFNLTPAAVPVPNQNILVNVARNVSASVYPGSGFLYQLLKECTHWRGAGVAGPVEIYNADTKQVFVLAQARERFTLERTTAATGKAKNSLNVAWHQGSELILEGTPGRIEVAPDSRKVFQGGNFSQMEIAYGANSEVNIRSLSSDYELHLEPLRNWSVQVNEGDAVRFRYDEGQGTFTGWASVDNKAPIVLVSPDGFTPTLPPGGSITILIESPGLYLSGVEGSIVLSQSGGPGQAVPIGTGQVFYEGSGTGPSTFGSGTIGGGLPSRNAGRGWIDPTRVPRGPLVEQPPVSVYGNR